jgi:hypothetical protein
VEAFWATNNTAQSGRNPPVTPGPLIFLLFFFFLIFFYSFLPSKSLMANGISVDVSLVDIARQLSLKSQQ